MLGVGRALREKYPDVKLIAIEPSEAAVLSGDKEVRDHKIAGIGDGFIPDIVKMDEIDFVAKVASDAAVEMSKKLCRQFGLMVGISSGANLLGAFQTLDRIGKDKCVVTVLPDRTERYFSTDLYVFHEHLVRRCTTSCQCIFA